MGQRMDQPIGQPMRQPMGQHMGQAIGQPMCHPARQLMGLLNTVAKPSQNADSNNPLHGWYMRRCELMRPPATRYFFRVSGQTFTTPTSRKRKAPHDAISFGGLAYATLPWFLGREM